MQSAEAQGSGNTIIQIAGDGNTLLSGHPHLRLTRYFNRRVVRRALDWLSPYTRSSPLIGREHETQDLQAWLDDLRPMLARVITGAGGRGKTRLALELCERASAAGWAAGFASRPELARFFAQQSLAEWSWQKPTLIVMDYAAQHTQALAPWLEELVDRADSPVHALRLLLLEREASLQSGWCAQVFAGSGFGASSKLALLDPPQPVELAPLASDANRLAVVESLLNQIAPDRAIALPRERSAVQLSLRRSEWAGDPLYLLMAAMNSVELGHASALALGRTDLALELARREQNRICELAEQHRLDARLVVHLAACVTLMQGVERYAFQAFADEEKHAVHRPNGGDPAVLADLLHQALPARAGIAPISPDLIGEAFVLNALDNPAEALAVLRCYKRQGLLVAQSVIRCAQDFSPERAEPLNWLKAMVEAIADNEAALTALKTHLPAESVVLRELNLRVAKRLYELCRHNSDPSAEQRAASANGLAVAFARAGQREPALRAAQEAVDIRRELATLHPDVFRPDLAMSLNTLANTLSDLGQRKPALQAAQEATDLYRELAALHPEAFRPYLAMSLHTLANRLSALGQREPALQAAQEAVDVRRELAALRPDVFRPNLAMSLNTLANRLSELGQHKPALQAAQEAVGIRRELAALRPDVFQPNLAGSLNTLANTLNHLGQHKPALQAAQEAVGIRRELAALRPDVFRPDLAGSLNTLANTLSDLGWHKPALQAAQEATDLYRELAALRPDVFRPDLARSLAILALSTEQDGSTDRALQLSHEALSVLTLDLLETPAAFAKLAKGIKGFYLHLCSQLEQEPDTALIARIRNSIITQGVRL